MSLSLVCHLRPRSRGAARGRADCLGRGEVEPQKGAVRFRGSWPEVWRANYWLRTANRVLVELASWPARDRDELAAGALALVRGQGRAAGRGEGAISNGTRFLGRSRRPRGSGQVLSFALARDRAK